MTRNIQGQMCRITVANFGSGSDLSFDLKIRYDLKEERLLKERALKKYVDYLAAPQESDRTEMQREMIWVVLTCPVLSTITIC